MHGDHVAWRSSLYKHVYICCKERERWIKDKKWNIKKMLMDPKISMIISLLTKKKSRTVPISHTKKKTISPSFSTHLPPPLYYHPPPLTLNAQTPSTAHVTALTLKQAVLGWLARPHNFGNKSSGSPSLKPRRPLGQQLPDGAGSVVARRPKEGGRW